MGWWELLPPETRRDLMRRTQLRRPDAIAARAIETAAFDADFARLRARVVTSPEQLTAGYLMMNKPKEFPIVLFSGSEEQFSDLVVLALEDEMAPDTTDVDRGGRPPGSYVETVTFWKVFAMALAEGTSARQIERVTKKRAALKRDDEDWLEYVNREKAGPIVETVKLNPIAARRSLSGRRPPRGFSATRYGVLLPERKPA